jgi:nucleoporin NUP82
LSSSLLKLGRREYDPTVDADEPLQTVLFVKKKAKATGYGIHDVNEAVSFAIGQRQNDWAPHTPVWPHEKRRRLRYLPFHADEGVRSLPLSRLSSFSLPFQVYRIHTLGEQFELGDVDVTLYDQQSIYVRSLIKAIPAFETPPHPNQVVPVQRPITIKVELVVQGPFLIQPAPDETEPADGFREGACDLLYVSYKKLQKKHKEVSSGPEIPLLLIAYQHGRVDICFDLDKIEPIWHSNSVSHSSPTCKMIRSSRSRVRIYPLLAVFESVGLGIATIFRSSGRGLQEHDETWILFKVDPLYPDTVYVYHCLVFQSLQMGAWLDAITELVMEKDPQTRVPWLLALRG